MGRPCGSLAPACPTATTDDFRQELYDMGIEDCMEIYQEALDRYQQR